MSTLAEWLEGRPFTLALSAGFFGFFAHAGFLTLLAERGLVPRRIVGVSAGALAGGLFAAGIAPAVLRDELFSLRKEDFWDPGPYPDGLLAGRKFAERLAAILGPARPAGALAVPFASVAFDLFARRTVVLSEDIPLDLAIRASCAVPIMFRPVRAGGRLLVDGGIADRAGLCALAPDEPTLLHYLPSKSPWRRLFRTARAPVPTRAPWRLVSTQAPRVGPNRLENGPAAFEAAYARAAAALDAPGGPWAGAAGPA